MRNTNSVSQQDQEMRGLRIKNMNYGFVVVLAIIAVVLFAVALLLLGEYREVTQIHDNYHKVVENAAMVQSASEDLTKDIQYFVMTGDKKYMDSYFTEANVTKRRENAIADLKQLHVTASMFTYLEDAVNESMSLMLLEYEAMRYASEGFGLDISDLPQVVQDTELPEDSKSMSAEEKIDRAREIVFGDEYLSYKNRISGFDDQYAEEAIKLMESMSADGRHKMILLLMALLFSIILVVIIGTIFFFTISRMIVRPLDKAVKSIISGEKMPQSQILWDRAFRT